MAYRRVGGLDFGVCVGAAEEGGISGGILFLVACHLPFGGLQRVLAAGTAAGLIDVDRYELIFLCFRWLLLVRLWTGAGGARFVLVLKMLSTCIVPHTSLRSMSYGTEIPSV